MNLSIINVLNVFATAPIALVGLFFSVFTIIVLSRIKDSEVFAYFKRENFFTLIDCLIAITFPIYKCKNCFGNAIDPSTQCIIDLVLYYFLSPVVEMSALFLGILAALLYLSSFSTNARPKYALIFKLGPNVLAIFAFVLSGINFSYLFFIIEIGTYTVSNDSFNYECQLNDFSRTLEATTLITITCFFSYGLLIIVLIIINATIVFKLRNSVGDVTAFTRELNLRRRHIGKRLTKIIVADCFNLTAARFTFAVWYMIESFSQEFYYNYAYVIGFFSVISYVCVILKFFLFYSLNSRFNNECKGLFSEIKNKFIFELPISIKSNQDLGNTDIT